MSAHQDIRGVLIRAGATQLLLPNATISEVLSYSPPEAVTNAPDWLLGRMRWRGWRLPLVAFPVLSQQGDEQAELASKVVVLKTLGGDARLPFFALLTEGFPRLVTISEANLLDESDGDGDALPFAVRARVRLNDDIALIPDIDVIEQSVREALAA